MKEDLDKLNNEVDEENIRLKRQEADKKEKEIIKETKSKKIAELTTSVDKNSVF